MRDMTRACRDERGQVIVLGAVMIPVLLLLTALVVDVGNWYTHKRQLQNRADAAAFAAAVEYGRNWKNCVQTTDATIKANTAQKIGDSARQYAGDPDAADYAGGVLPSGPLENTQIANQAKVDVAINSTSYGNNTDYSDDGDGNAATTLGNPCYRHMTGDSISAPGYWTDVKVQERNLPSLFGGVGLPLSRNGARARVDIRPAISGTRFLPLAVPDNVITKVQIRYYNECTGQLIPNSTFDLKPLPSTAQAAYASTGGGMLWGLPNPGKPDEGDPNRSFGLALPGYDSSCGDYLPVGEEVRVASQDNIDLNQSCSALQNSRFADCFHRLTQIRIYNDGNPTAQPRLTNVRLTGGCGGLADAYFSVLPTAVTSCKYDVTAQVDWGTRDDGNLNVPANFSVKANGVSLTPPSGSPTGLWTTSGGALTLSTAGPNTISIALSWTDTNGSHSWPTAADQCKNGNNNPCKYSGTEAAHRAFVGTKATSGAVGLVRNSGNGFAGNPSVPSAPFDNSAGNATVQIFPTVGTVSVLKTGVFTTLRLDDPQANQTLRCDPDYAQGQEFSAFLTGCKPWYGKNTWASPWWVGTPKACPPSSDWFSNGTPPLGKNSSGNYWQCVLTAPGMSTGQVGDDIAVATDNCDNINNNSCQTFDCNYDGNYDGKPGNPTGWVAQADSRYPRVVNLFIVPYQSSKGLTGAGDTIPILGFASFYVTNWTGANVNQSDPCPDLTWDSDGNPATPQVTLPATPKGAISGFFVETVDYEPGPVDPNATCVEGELTPCRAVLVR
jgi:Putative Flp pilus-assembly TadE/G-like